MGMILISIRGTVGLTDVPDCIYSVIEKCVLFHIMLLFCWVANHMW